jgi:protein TonB
MEKISILSADILDILFDGRNKNYGAYDLRKTYRKRIVYAMGGTFFICLLFVVGTILAKPKKTGFSKELVTDVELKSIKDDPPKTEPPPPPPPTEPPRVEMSRVTPPLIVQDELVTPDDEVKDIDKIEDTRIGTINTEGIKDDGVVAPPAEKPTGTAKLTAEHKEIDDKFIAVQIAAEFPGGVAGWTKYLERSLNRDLPSSNGAPPASYTVVVSFIVDVNGAISDVRAENDPGYGTKEEAIRVIKKGPHWKPASQNGTAVVYRHKQSITFRVSEE